MLTQSLPHSLTSLLAAFAPCFHLPTFQTFQALVAGFLTHPGPRTITGMLTGSGLARRRHHDLAYRFFARVRWCPDQAGLIVCDLITTWLLADHTPLLVAVDDTLWRRSGRRLHGAAWHHDGNGPGRHRPAWGHRWVVLGVIVTLPGCSRPVCLPILARLWIPGDLQRTPLTLARELLDLLVTHLDGRGVHLVGDAAYIGQRLRGLPPQVTLTARLRADAALWTPPPPRLRGQRGRPRKRGTRLPSLAHIAGMPAYVWTRTQVTCYGTRTQREVLSLRCLWYGALGGQLVQVVLSRPVGAPDGYDLALVSTDLTAAAAGLIGRYADRWPIETMFLQARHLAGVGTARTRTRRSVERVVPFGLVCYSLAVVWYAQHGQPAADLARHRARAPWYRSKQTVSAADMLSALRRALLVAQFPQGRADLRTCELFPDMLLAEYDRAA